MWPNLQVLFGGGVNAEPYRPVIEKRVGRAMILMDNYNATEGGIFAVTDRIGEPGMLVVPDRGVFFEFVPAAEHGKPDARRVPLWEVEPGVDYSIAVTHLLGPLRLPHRRLRAVQIDLPAPHGVRGPHLAACSRSPRS